MAIIRAKRSKKMYDYILQTSFQNAEKVKSALLFSTKKLADQPEIHPPNKYKKTIKAALELTSYTTTKFPITWLTSK